MLITIAGQSQLDTSAIKEMLIGRWEWLSSRGGFTGLMEYTPESTGKTEIFSIIEEKGKLYKVRPGKKEAIVLRYEETIFGKKMWMMENEADSILHLSLRTISFFGKDNLNLSNNHVEAYSYSYKRIPEGKNELIHREFIESDCAGTGGDEGVQQSYDAILNGNQLNIDAEMFFNCCSEKYIEILKDGNVLTIKAKDSVTDEGSLCKCFCLYPVDLSITLDPFQYYTLVFDSGYDEPYVMNVSQSNSVCPECSSWIHFEDEPENAETNFTSFNLALNEETGELTADITAMVDCMVSDPVYQYKFWGKDTLVIEAITQPVETPEIACQAFSYQKISQTIQLPAHGEYAVLYNNQLKPITTTRIKWEEPASSFNESIENTCYTMALAVPVFEDVTFDDGVFKGNIYFMGDDCNDKHLVYKLNNDTIRFEVASTKMACSNHCINKAEFSISELGNDSYVVTFPKADTLYIKSESFMPISKFNYEIEPICDSYTGTEEKVTVTVENGTLTMKAFQLLNCCGEHSMGYTISNDTLAFSIEHTGEICRCECMNEITATIKDFDLTNFVVTIDGESVYPACKAPEIEEMSICKGEGIIIGDEIAITVYDNAGEPFGEFPFNDLPLGSYKASAKEACIGSGTTSAESWFTLNIIECSMPKVRINTSKDSYTLKTGDETDITAFVESLSNEILADDDKAVVWSISENNIIEYSTSGNTLHISAKKEGSLIATAHWLNDANISAEVTITIVAEIKTQIIINGTSVEGEIECKAGDSLLIDIKTPEHMSMKEGAQWEIVSGNEFATFNADSSRLIAFAEGEVVIKGRTAISGTSTEELHIKILKSSGGATAITKTVQAVLAPNPADEFVQITAPTTIIRCSISSLSGKSFEVIELNSNECRLDISKLPPSYYFIKLIFADGDSETLQFMKK